MARKTVQRILLLLMVGALAVGLCDCSWFELTIGEEMSIAENKFLGAPTEIILGEYRLVVGISGSGSYAVCNELGGLCRTPSGDDDSETAGLSAIPEFVGSVAPPLRPAPIERRAVIPTPRAGPARSRKVLLVGRDNLRLLDIGANAVTATVDLSGRFGSQVAVSSDGALAAVGVRRFRSAAPDGVDIIEVPAMTRIATVDLSVASGPSGISFIPGRRDFCVALSNEDAVRCFSLNDAGAAAPLREFTGCEEAGKVAFTADGERGLFLCKDSLWVYDILSDSVARKITGFGAVRSLAVTLDGRRAYVTDI